MPVFRMSRRVRYRECDPMGVVYHTHFLDWFEAGRTEALRELGLSYKRVEDSGVLMPVIEARVRYRGPAHYDDVVVVETTFQETLPTMRIKTDYRVSREGDNALLASGEVTLCFVDSARRRPIAAPPLLLDALRTSGFYE